MAQSQNSRRKTIKTQNFQQQNINKNEFNSINSKRERYFTKQKQKTPLHCLDLNFVQLKYVSTKTANNQRKLSLLLKNSQNTINQTEHFQKIGKKLHVEENSKQQQWIMKNFLAGDSLKQSQSQRKFMTNRYNFQFIDENNFCFQNKEIKRCSSALQVNKFVMKREQQLKKCTQRGETLKKGIKQKYGNYKRKNKE